MQIGHGRGATRGVVWLVFLLVAAGILIQLCANFGFLRLVKGQPWCTNS